MPVQGPQQPGFFLPGAEYFSLSPNTNIALQGRRRHLFVIPSTGIGAGLTQVLSTSFILEAAPFVLSSGIYIHKFALVLVPADQSSELQVVGTFAGISFSGTVGAGVPLGIPVLTQTTPAGSTTGLVEQELLLTGQDILAATPASSPGGQLFLNVAVGFKNLDATNPHFMQISSYIVFTRLDGLIE